jgi:hypothetical protein
LKNKMSDKKMESIFYKWDTLPNSEE